MKKRGNFQYFGEDCVEGFTNEMSEKETWRKIYFETDFKKDYDAISDCVFNERCVSCVKKNTYLKLK